MPLIFVKALLIVLTLAVMLPVPVAPGRAQPHPDLWRRGHRRSTGSGSYSFLCFLSGLLIRTVWAQRLLEGFDSHFLGKLPFYALLRSLFSEMAGSQKRVGLNLAPARIEECCQPAVAMEELENGCLVVFVPQAPTPFSGAVFYMPPDRVKRIASHSADMFTSMSRFGASSRDLLKGQL